LVGAAVGFFRGRFTSSGEADLPSLGMIGRYYPPTLSVSHRASLPSHRAIKMNRASIHNERRSAITACDAIAHPVRTAQSGRTRAAQYFHEIHRRRGTGGENHHPDKSGTPQRKF
jgi:hypothetical protein